jgi:O-antigen ligase
VAHKNTLGAVAVLAIPVFTAASLGRRIHWRWAAGLCALSLLTLVATQSRTAMACLPVVAAICAYLLAVWGTGRPSAARWRRVSIGLVCAVSILPFLIAPLALWLGDDDPLNGRGRLWTGATAILRERPLTGYGFAAVWARTNASLLPHIPITAHRSASSAHNSIVHIATELGIPAAIVASVFLVVALVNSGRLFARTPSAFSFVAVALLIGIVVLGFTEAHLLQIHWPFWILCVALPIAVQRALDASERGAVAAADAPGR